MHHLDRAACIRVIRGRRSAFTKHDPCRSAWIRAPFIQQQHAHDHRRHHLAATLAASAAHAQEPPPGAPATRSVLDLLDRRGGSAHRETGVVRHDPRAVRRQRRAVGACGRRRGRDAGEHAHGYATSCSTCSPAALAGLRAAPRGSRATAAPRRVRSASSRATGARHSPRGAARARGRGTARAELRDAGQPARRPAVLDSVARRSPAARARRPPRRPPHRGASRGPAAGGDARRDARSRGRRRRRSGAGRSRRADSSPRHQRLRARGPGRRAAPRPDAVSQTLGFRTLEQPDGGDVWQLKLMLHALGHFRADTAELPRDRDANLYSRRPSPRSTLPRRAGLSTPAAGSPPGLVDAETCGACGTRSSAREGGRRAPETARDDGDRR